MFNAFVAATSLLIDRWFGEFLSHHHPVVWMGRWIHFFEKNFYANSIRRGAILWLSTLVLFTGLATLLSLGLSQLPLLLAWLVASLIGSTLLAHRMLFDSVRAVAQSATPQKNVAMLVSRDCQQMSKSDAYKAAIETYAENLSDGFIAPWFFLLMFGLPGIVLYKAINTLDSMVGYRTKKYEKFGKFAAICDDLANLIPARLTAMVILLSFQHWRFWQFYPQGRKHPSPNAGHPISAMAHACHCRLGGPTFYFGKLKPKAYFGKPDAPRQIEPKHVFCALSRRNILDGLMVTLSLVIGLFLLGK